MIKGQISDPLWSGGNKNMSNKSMAEIKVLKEQAKKERQKKAAAHYASQTFKCSDDMTFNLQQIQPNEGTFLSDTIKTVLGDYNWFAQAIQSKESHLYLGLDNTIPGTPEVKDVEFESPINGLFKKSVNKNGTSSHLQKVVNDAVSKNPSLLLNSLKSSKNHMKTKPPHLSMPKNKETNNIEKILKEMTQQLIPPLSDIETPGKVNNRFAFPAQPKEKGNKGSPKKDVKKSNKTAGSHPKSKHNKSDLTNAKVSTDPEQVTAKVPPSIVSSVGKQRLVSTSSTSSSDDSSSDGSSSSDSEDENETCARKLDNSSVKINKDDKKSVNTVVKPLHKNDNNNYIINKSNDSLNLSTKASLENIKPSKSSCDTLISPSLNDQQALDNHDPLSACVVENMNSINTKDVALNNINAPSKVADSNHFKTDRQLNNLLNDHSLAPLLSSTQNSTFDPSSMKLFFEKPISPFETLFDDLDFTNTSNDNFLDLLMTNEPATNTTTMNSLSKSEQDKTPAATLPLTNNNSFNNSFSDSLDQDLDPSLILNKKSKGVGSLYQKDRKNTNYNGSKQAKTTHDVRNKSINKINETKEKSKSKSARLSSSSSENVVGSNISSCVKITEKSTSKNMGKVKTKAELKGDVAPLAPTSHSKQKKIRPVSDTIVDHNKKEELKSKIYNKEEHKKERRSSKTHIDENVKAAFSSHEKESKKLVKDTTNLDVKKHVKDTTDLDSKKHVKDTTDLDSKKHGKDTTNLDSKKLVKETTILDSKKHVKDTTNLDNKKLVKETTNLDSKNHVIGTTNLNNKKLKPVVSPVLTNPTKTSPVRELFNPNDSSFSFKMESQSLDSEFSTTLDDTNTNQSLDPVKNLFNHTLDNTNTSFSKDIETSLSDLIKVEDDFQSVNVKEDFQSVDVNDGFPTDDVKDSFHTNKEDNFLKDVKSNFDHNVVFDSDVLNGLNCPSLKDIISPMTSPLRTVESTPIIENINPPSFTADKYELPVEHNISLPLNILEDPIPALTSSQLISNQHLIEPVEKELPAKQIHKPLIVHTDMKVEDEIKEEEDGSFSDMEICTPIDEKPIILNDFTMITSSVTNHNIHEVIKEKKKNYDSKPKKSDTHIELNNQKSIIDDEKPPLVNNRKEIVEDTKSTLISNRKEIVQDEKPSLINNRKEILEDTKPPLINLKTIIDEGKSTLIKGEKTPLIKGEKTSPKPNVIPEDIKPKLTVKIPLKSIKLKDATLVNYKNRTSLKNEKLKTYNNLKPFIKSPISNSNITDGDEIDVETYESPKKKRKKSIGNKNGKDTSTLNGNAHDDSSYKVEIESNKKITNTDFKNPNNMDFEKLVVRISLSRLKRTPKNGKHIEKAIKHPKSSKKQKIQEPIKKEIKEEPPSDAKGAIIDVTLQIPPNQAPVHAKVEPLHNNNSNLENTPMDISSHDESSSPAPAVTEKMKKKRGRPPKDAIKTVKKKVDKEGSIIKKEEDELTPKKPKDEEKYSDSNICCECGTMKKDPAKDPSRTSSYKKSYGMYLDEGQRRKRVADCLKDPVERPHTYVDAVLNYVQYLVGLEFSGNLGTKQGVEEHMQICTECIPLVDYVINRYGCKVNPKTNSYDRRFLFLCLRLESILYLKLFKLKKDSANKYSKVLTDYYKQYKPGSNISGPSPHQNTLHNRGSTGTPSPNSPSPGPSPGGSVASIGSAGSCHSAGSNTAPLIPTTISIPTAMNEKAFQYHQYTKYLLHAHRLWDDAEKLTTQCQSFLNSLSKKAGQLTMQSSLIHVVDYISAGLKLIKESPIT